MEIKPRTIAFLTVLLMVASGPGCNRNDQGSSAESTYSSSSAERAGTPNPLPNAASATNRIDSAAASQSVDNSARNARDRSGATLTPADQGGSQSDLDLTRRIRRALNENSQLSTDAKNIKIITVGGKVTLRGPVQNEQEAKTISETVKGVAGSVSIDNQLEVKTTNQ